ncbi:MAG: hypothetical protein DCC71_01010, partial [Proteobacteria bacterium]
MQQSRPTTSPTTSFWLHALFALAIGIWLRVHGFAAQIPISDEWHGLQAAAQESYLRLATLMTAGATSIPYNLYLRWLLHEVGWSEWTIRLPALAAGIATVALAPLLLRRTIGARGAALTGVLLAISPLLVLYSRYARPYSLVVLLALVALLACHRWATTGSRRAAVALVAACALAAWLHVLEIRLFALCLGAVAAARLVAPRWPALAVAPSWRAIAGVALAGALAIAAL